MSHTPTEGQGNNIMHPPLPGTKSPAIAVNDQSMPNGSVFPSFSGQNVGVPVVVPATPSLTPAAAAGIANPFGLATGQIGNFYSSPQHMAMTMMANSAAAAMGGSGGGIVMPLQKMLPQPSPGSSDFFSGWNLRSGKWLQEEEIYADLLVCMFDQGQLSDCMTGSTLRAYLAEKLHCAPMRISKKFAGKGIGKKVYSSKVDGTRKNIPTHVLESRRQKMETLAEAEKKFHEAVSSDMPPLSASLAMPGFMPFLAPAHSIPHAIQSMAAAQQYFSLLQQQVFQTMNPPVISLPTQTVPFGAPSPSAPIPVASAAVTGVTQQLQESFAKALDGERNTAVPTTMLNSNQSDTRTAAMHISSTNNGTTQQNRGVAQLFPDDASAPQTRRSVFTGSEEVPATKVSYVVVPIQPSENRAKRTTTVSLHAKLRSTTNPTQMSAMEHPSFPDFMAGFDKAALSIKHPKDDSAVSHTEQSDLQCSPPFTSRSFDDFHKLLGKDLSPLGDGSAKTNDQNNAQAQKLVGKKERIDVDSDSASKKFDRASLFTAESYAMFAQESARAASQHAAYIPHDRLPPPTHPHRSHRIGSFDFDSTMKLVSQHVPVAVGHSHMAATTSNTRTASTQLTLPRTAREDEDETKNDPTYSSVRSRTCESEKFLPLVSGSEPASSAAESSSFRGSTSESNGSDNTFSNSEDGQFESGEDSHSSDDSSCNDTEVSRAKKPIKEDPLDDNDSDDGTGIMRKRRKVCIS